MEDARAGAKPRLSHRDLRRRPRDLVPERQSRRGVAESAQDYEQAEAHGQRGEDTNLQGPGRRVRLSGLHVRANVFCENRSCPLGISAIEEEHQAHGSECPWADRSIGDLARYHKAGRRVESHAARMGELLPSRHRQQSVPGGRQLYRGAVASVAARQVQGQATQGRDLSTLAPFTGTPPLCLPYRLKGEQLKTGNIQGDPFTAFVAAIVAGEDL